jgi:hypothetical protein
MRWALIHVHGAQAARTKKAVAAQKASEEAAAAAAAAAATSDSPREWQVYRTVRKETQKEREEQEQPWGCV